MKTTAENYRSRYCRRCRECGHADARVNRTGQSGGVPLPGTPSALFPSGEVPTSLRSFAAGDNDLNTSPTWAPATPPPHRPRRTSSLVVETAAPGVQDTLQATVQERLPSERAEPERLRSKPRHARQRA